ncbi:hypothetical protein EV1_020847 [Malus domestica]
MKLQNPENCIEVALVVIKQRAICLPAGVGDESDVRNGAVKEDDQEEGAPCVYRQAPSSGVVVGDPISLGLWASVTRV